MGKLNCFNPITRSNAKTNFQIFEVVLTVILLGEFLN